MKKIDIGQTITILANIGIISSIIFLGLEFRQNSEAAQIQAAQSYLNLSHQLDFRIVDDPSLVTLLRTPLENMSPIEKFRLDRWHFGLFRTWESGFYLYKRGVLEEDLWSGQVEFIRYMLNRDSSDRDYFLANRKYFSDGFGQFIDGLIEAK